jgi:hypothetical protein
VVVVVVSFCARASLRCLSLAASARAGAGILASMVSRRSPGGGSGSFSRQPARARNWKVVRVCCAVLRSPRPRALSNPPTDARSTLLRRVPSTRTPCREQRTGNARGGARTRGRKEGRCDSRELRGLAVSSARALRPVLLYVSSPIDEVGWVAHLLLDYSICLCVGTGLREERPLLLSRPDRRRRREAARAPQAAGRGAAGKSDALSLPTLLDHIPSPTLELVVQRVHTLLDTLPSLDPQSNVCHLSKAATLSSAAPCPRRSKPIELLPQ